MHLYVTCFRQMLWQLAEETNKRDNYCQRSQKDLSFEFWNPNDVS